MPTALQNGALRKVCVRILRSACGGSMAYTPPSHILRDIFLPILKR